MERVSSKHGPRLDDQQKHEEHALLHGTPDEGRTEERTIEAPDEDELADDEPTDDEAGVG